MQRTRHHSQLSSALSHHTYTHSYILLTLLLLLLALLPSTLSLFINGTEYRNYNGSNNNLNNPLWGAAGSAYIRYALPASYADSISSPADVGRPNPRQVSNTIFGSGPFAYTSYSLASIKSAWGQLVAHDIAWTQPTTGAAAESYNIPIPCCDARWDSGCSCTKQQPFLRAAWDNNTGTSSSNPRLQLNFQTGNHNISPSCKPLAIALLQPQIVVLSLLVLVGL